MTKVDDEDNRLSRCGWLGNVVRPDLAAQDVALLHLRMPPLGGHVIRRLPGFLPDEMSIPATPLPSLPLLPLLPDVDVGNGGQDACSISHGPSHIVTCVSHLPHHGQSKSSKQQQTHHSADPISKGDMALLLYTCSCSLNRQRSWSVLRRSPCRMVRRRR
jgi:hypothetical protein